METNVEFNKFKSEPVEAIAAWAQPQSAARVIHLPTYGAAPAYEQDMQAYDAARVQEAPDLLVALYLRMLSRRALYEAGKRALDLAVSLLLIIVTLPLFVIIALLVKASSPGPVFFKHKRLGRGGREFYCYKFRTMIVDAEAQLDSNPDLRRQFEQRYKLESDPRVTRLGAFLRKASLDELPQLFQILRGEMSLIGPRPIVRDELKRYGIHAGKLLAVKPGLSGLWQVCRQRDTTYGERVQMDVFYHDHRCLSLDLLLLFYTAVSVIKRRGAC